MSANYHLGYDLESSVLKWAGYNFYTNTLLLTFKANPGQTFQYQDASPELFSEIVQSNSPGGTYNRLIRGRMIAHVTTEKPVFEPHDELEEDEGPDMNEGTEFAENHPLVNTSISDQPITAYYTLDGAEKQKSFDSRAKFDNWRDQIGNFNRMFDAGLVLRKVVEVFE